MQWWDVMISSSTGNVSCYAIEADLDTGAAFAAGVEFAQDEDIREGWHDLEVEVTRRTGPPPPQ